jgi:cell wall-associated NlpC family hydrolase
MYPETTTARMVRPLRHSVTALSDGFLSQQTARLARKLGRGGLAALGVTSAFLVTAAGWPASAAAATHTEPGTARQVQSVALSEALAHSQSALVPVPGSGSTDPQVAPLRHLRHADLMVVSPSTLPASALAAINKLPGVRAAVPVDAARIKLNGKFVAVLGVDPSAFRAFADKPTAADTKLWRGVAQGNVAVSYTMGRLAKLPTGSVITASGQQQETLMVGGLGTVGIPGVDAVVSDTVARSLGFPSQNAIVISASKAHLKTRKTLKRLTARVTALVPKTAAVEPLVLPGAAATAGTVTTAAGSSQAGGQLTAAQATAMLRAALSRVGMPYVWGAEGPRAFDCSGLVQWSFAQAGLVIPRVAADQARTGPAVPLKRLQPGDLLFYHTDPTAPSYISHVAIYLGKGYMIQAPQPGMNVEVVPLALGSEFAGAVAVSPRTAAEAATSPVG